MGILQTSTINIKNNEHHFVYGVGYHDTQTIDDNNPLSYEVQSESGKIFIHNTNYLNIIGDVNEFYESDNIGSTQYIPQPVHTSDVQIYIPSYCIDYYNHEYKYVVEISTYIGKYKVILGSYLLDKMELLALSKPIKILDKTYYVGRTYTIIDPWYFIYDDSWTQFRRNVCDTVFINSDEINNDTSLLNVEITPVVFSEDHWIKGIYTSGICSFIIQRNESNNISFTTTPEFNEYDGLVFKSSLGFNPAYIQDLSGLNDYIKSTYTFSDDYNTILYTSYILADHDGNFSDPIVTERMNVDEFLTKNSTTGYGQWVNDWSDWKEGMFLTSMINIYLVENNVEAEAPLLTIMSPDIPITYEIFKYMISNDNYIDLTDMEITTINAVNKIEKKIINVERPDDYNSPIYMPIYIPSSQTDDIQVHNRVNESIAINLSAYVNTVKVFSLMIGDVVFNEVARRGGNVVFKITGKLLPEEPVSGIYYILNEANELVTTGNYKYIS